MSRLVLALLAVCAGLAALTAGPVAAQDGALRERIRERLQQQQPPAAASTADPITQPGDYRFSLQHDGQTRLYRVHVPASYTPLRPASLLLFFHGGGGNMEHAAEDRYYGMVSKSESAGFVAVFPNGYSRLQSGKLATWNAGNCCAGARERNNDDVGFVRDMLARLRTQLNIDAARIFATGMSNGGMFSYRLACEMPDTFRAIASVAGTDGTSVCTPAKSVSVLHIHARDDELVLFNGGAGKDSRTLANFVAVPDSIAKWARIDACSTPPRRVLEVPGAYCESYAPCRGGTEVRLCVTESGGHSWPGGSKVRTGAKGSDAIAATDLIWDFFQASSSAPR
jgi:polyhydroxybutyrate depolymerase